MDLQEVLTQVTGLINNQAELHKQAIAELKKTGAVPSEFKEKLELMAKETEKLSNAYTDYQKSAEDQKKEAEALKAQVVDLEARLNRKGKEEDEEHKIIDPGKFIVEAKDVKDLLGEVEKYGASSLKRNRAVRVDINGFGLKDIISSVQGVQLIQRERRPGILAVPDLPMTVRSLIPTIPTSSPAVEWVKEGTHTNNAGPQYDGTTSPPTYEGAKKNKSDLQYTLVSSTVKTIAHYMKASKQILADVPQLQEIINSRLLYFLALEEEEELLRGDGTAGSLQGLIPQAADYDTLLNNANDTKIDRLRHALLQVTRSRYMPTGIVVNPEDWHDIELTKTNEGTTSNQGSYLLTNPAAQAPKRLWGYPVLDSLSMNVGEFLVGSFRLGAQIFDREQASVEIATTNEDDFVRNMVTILAEERIMLAVIRPDAFVEGAFA